MTTGDLASTADFDESGTPLLIAEQGENGKWRWSETKFNIPNKYGITLTTHIEPTSEFWNENGFWQNGGNTGQFIAENYSGVVVPFFWHQIYSAGEIGDFNLSKAYVKLTNNIENPELIGGSLLYGE